jgi:hypothetical protein
VATLWSTPLTVHCESSKVSFERPVITYYEEREGEGRREGGTLQGWRRRRRDLAQVSGPNGIERLRRRRIWMLSHFCREGSGRFVPTQMLEDLEEGLGREIVFR